MAAPRFLPLACLTKKFEVLFLARAQFGLLSGMPAGEIYGSSKISPVGLPDKKV
jgi:hypothetical protein